MRDNTDPQALGESILELRKSGIPILIAADRAYAVLATPDSGDGTPTDGGEYNPPQSSGNGRGW